VSIIELGALGEFFGSIAVLATLIYLAIQVRHARSEVRLSAQVARHQGVRDHWLNRSQNPMLVEAMIQADSAFEGRGVFGSPFVKALTDQAGLSVRDAYLVQCDQILQWQNWVATVENLENQSADSIARMNSAIRTFYTDSFGRLFWDQQKKANVEKKAVQYIGNVLSP
jgi:hypothetical protein